MNIRWDFSQDGKMIGGMLIFFAVLFSRFLFSTDQIIYNYDISYFYPHETVIRHSLEQNDFLLWNPYFGGGSPQLGKIQIGHLYPTSVLLRNLVPIVTMFNWDAFLHVFLTGLGIHVLLRSLGVIPVMSTMSGIVFALSGSIIPRVLAGHVSVLHTITWIGWLLFAYIRLLHGRSWRNFLLTVLFTSLVILGGHLQFSLIVFIVPVGYFFFVYFPSNVPTKNWKDITFGLMASLFVGLITICFLAVQILPFFEWLGHTSRGSGEAIISFEFMVRNSLNLEHILTQILPFVWFEPSTRTILNLTGFSLFWEISPFIGVTTIFFLITSILIGGIKDQRLGRFFGGLALFGLIMSLGQINPIYQLVYDQLPFFRAPGRLLLLWTFSLVILFGLSMTEGHQYLSRSSNRINFKNLYSFSLPLCIFSVIFLWGVWLFRGDNLVSLINNHEQLKQIDQEIIVNTIRKSLGMFTLALVLITGLLRLGRQVNGKSQTWQWITLMAIITEMVFFTLPLLKPKKIEALFRSDHPFATLELDAKEVRFPDYRLPPNYLLPTLAHVQNGEESIALVSLLNYGQRGRNLLAGGYKASSEPILNEPEYQLVQQTENAYLYEHIRNLPRIYAAPSFKVVESDNEALEYVTDELFNAFDQAVMTIPQADRSSIPKLLPSNTTDTTVYSAKFLTYTNNALSAQIVANKPMMVVFNEMFYPGWQATLDGRPTIIWKTNYTFRGIVVDEGTHLIEMSYRPRSYQIGLTITLVTLALVIFISGWNGISATKNQGGAREFSAL